MDLNTFATVVKELGAYGIFLICILAGITLGYKWIRDIISKRKRDKILNSAKEYIDIALKETEKLLILKLQELTISKESLAADLALLKEYINKSQALFSFSKDETIIKLLTQFFDSQKTQSLLQNLSKQQIETLKKELLEKLELNDSKMQEFNKDIKYLIDNMLKEIKYLISTQNISIQHLNDGILEIKTKIPSATIDRL